MGEGGTKEILHKKYITYRNYCIRMAHDWKETIKRKIFIRATKHGCKCFQVHVLGRVHEACRKAYEPGMIEI